MGKNITIVGGHGNVSLRLTRLISSAHKLTSIIRDPSQIPAITSAGSIPLLLSLETSPVSDFITAFEGQDLIIFSAGGGGKGGPERTKKVDYEGALKVFDAIEQVGSVTKPRLVLVSAVDVRDEDKIPEHYNEQDISISKRMRTTIPAYMKWKYEADKNLSQRTAFKWTILRPGGLNNEPGTGRASIGRTHLTPTVSRDDVAKVLALLVNREDAAGLGIDIVGGDTLVEEGLDAFIKKGETDFLGLIGGAFKSF